MVLNYLSGFLDLIASIIIFYQSIILYKKKKMVYIFHNSLRSMYGGIRMCRVL